MAITNRYATTFKMTRSSDLVHTYSIQNRTTDVYITFRDADRLDIISNTIYGSPEYWWLILVANNYSIEFDIEEGEILRIPLPLADALNDAQKI